MGGSRPLPLASTLFADGYEFSQDVELAVFDGRGEDEAGHGVAVGEQRLDKSFEVGEAGGGDLKKEVVAAGKVMALAYFFEGLYVIEDAMVVLAGAAHADEREDFESEGLAIDVDGVIAEDADLFHLLEAFARRGRREADAPGEFGQAEACAGLKLVEELSPMNIEQGR